MNKLIRSEVRNGKNIFKEVIGIGTTKDLTRQLNNTVKNVTNFFEENQIKFLLIERKNKKEIYLENTIIKFVYEIK